MEATVYGMAGVEKVEHVRMRCTSKTCRSHHLYNFRWAGQRKLNSISVQDATHIFVTATKSNSFSTTTPFSSVDASQPVLWTGRSASSFGQAIMITLASGRIIRLQSCS